MAYRGKHNQYVREMMEGCDIYSKSVEGVDKHPNTEMASEFSMKNFAEWADPWNPIFNDADYAGKTKYGNIIAPPMYQDAITTRIYFPHLSEDGGFMNHNFAGEDWYDLHVIKPGDRFTTVHYPLKWEDITMDGEDTVPQFFFPYNFAEAINQNGEKVGGVLSAMDVSVLPDRLNSVAAALPYKDHCYTDDEWEYINKIIDNEVIRGADTLYWEDVHEGEEIQPCTIGPTTRWDMIAFCAARQELPFHPMRVWRNDKNMMLLKDEFNVTHLDVEWHNSNKQAAIMGDPRSFNYGGSGRTQMARLVTNWMGDDGEIRAFKWRHLKRTYTGECLIVKGRVVKRYITEAGEYAVDLDVWMDNAVRGNVSESALATVILPVKDSDNRHLEDLFFDISPKRNLKIGDRVRIKDRHDLFPTGYPLAGAEGVIAELFPWQRTWFNSYGDYVSVEIRKCDTVLGTGNTLFLKEEYLEKL